MAYGIEIRSAIGSDDITDLTSFRVFGVQTKTESTTTAAQTFNYTAPTGWTSSNGTFYILPNSSGILPNFSVTGATTLSANFASFNSTLKANSWQIFWLVKTGTDAPSGYGMQILNGGNSTVLSSETETLLKFSSGTLSSYTTSNTGYRQFSLPSGFSTTTDAIFVKLPNGADLAASSREFYNAADKYRLGSTTETSLEYFTTRRSFSLTSATGYGLAVYSAIGELVYSTDYDIFPSNGKTFTVSPSSSTSVDGTKDVWVNLNFGVPVPFCPDGGAGGFPTFNFISGVSRSGSTVSHAGMNMRNDPPSPFQQSTAHDNTALIVQR